VNKTISPLPQTDQKLVLKDPALAALLAWLVPGLGHVYQGRTAKGVLFFVCLVSTFVYGCYLGGSSKVGWGRVVYVAWRDDDTRLAYLCQVGIGLPALPAIVQASRAKKGSVLWWNGFMAPPRPEGGFGNGDAAAQHALAGQPSLDDLNFHLRGYFELGTAYTMIAGLLNILAVYDAWGGPVFPEPAKKEDEEETEEDSGTKDKGEAGKSPD
jgi:TM2 domain-containing membrane protein YozV